MNMKLLLFILGLTLCASWPAFSRNLAVNSEENNEEHSFLDFLDGELGEYENFADGDNDNSFDLFDLNFHLNEEGEVNTSLGEENNEEFLPEEPSDEPTEETPEEPTEETPEEPTEETPEENNEAVVETPEENTEAVVETPEENTEDTTQEEEENVEPTDETPVPEDLLTQVRGDAEANDVLNFGVSTVIAKGINTTKIPNDNFTVTSISTYNKTANTKGNLYQISCVATNANGSSVLNINFTVYYQLSNQRKTLSSWSYNIKTSNPVTPTTEYAQLGEEEIATETVQKVLNYGAAQIYAKGTQAGKIPVSDFTISDVVSVWKQATTNGFNYRCQVVLENNNKVVVNANFTVAYKSSNQQTSFIQWSYNVKNVTSNTNNNTTTPTNNTTPSNNTTQPTNNTTTPSNDTTNTNTTNNNTTQPSTNNTTPANNTNANNNGFVELDTAEIETSGEVQGALEYGTDQIIQSGNAKGKIPVSNYTITKVNSVERKTQSNGRNTYRCDVELQDAKKVITAQFTVYVKVATQEFSIGSWTYNISNIKTTNSNGSTNTTTNNNTNTNTNNTNSNTNTNTTNNTTNNNNNTTQPTTNTTSPANTTNSTTTNFTALTQDEINSAEVQGALNFGANRVIQIGSEKGQIPVSNYTVTKVNSVGKQVASNGRNLYRFDVELQDVNKVLVKAQFNVYVKVATQERTVGAWSYQVSNKGNTPKPSTNTTNSTNTKTL